MIVIPEQFEAEMPFRGPCGLCGGPDARHRVLDAIKEGVTAGDDEADFADLYDYSVGFVDAIVAHWRPAEQRWV